MKPVERHPWNHYGRRANQRDPGRRRLSTNVALLNASNSFTSFNGLTGVLVATNPTNQIPGTISANGSGLSNLNRANVAVGTIVNAGISATAAIAPLRATAEARGSGDFSPLWAGQNVTGCREIPAAELTRQLAQGTR